jgi:hypothetical protein
MDNPFSFTAVLKQCCCCLLPFSHGVFLSTIRHADIHNIKHIIDNIVVCFTKLLTTEQEEMSQKDDVCDCNVLIQFKEEQKEMKINIDMIRVSRLTLYDKFSSSFLYVMGVFAVYDTHNLSFKMS